MKRIIMAACIVSLAACGGDKDDVATEQQQDWESQKQSLVYSFPDDNQQQVPVPSPVVLRFSSPVMETSPAVVLREVGGPIISEFETEWVDGKRGLIITPDSKLKPMTDYMVQIPAIELEKGMAPAKNIRFSTRALFEGPKSLVASDTFEVTRMIPDGENYAVMDFSSFRVQFSQPLDQTTVKYGDSADSTVQLMGPEGLVDAHLLVSGHYMTIDPKEDLTPGAEYSLNMTTGIASTYGETLPGGSFGNPGDTLAVSVKASPQDTKAPGTGLRVSMVQDVADTGELSPLTGQPINLVPMASVLLGEDTATQASGTIAAELAFVPNFPEATPFRVKRGSLIEGASIEVLIGGEVPAGFESGKVRMDFLSDATGYLLPNPYSNSDDAPRQVRLFMDVAVSTETPAANGAVTQDLLHIELVGTSIVENGQMIINAVGVVEPNVLGSERATGILSFYMKAYEDQDNPPALIADTIPPVLQSQTPNGDSFLTMLSSDPLILNFNEAIDKESLQEGMIILQYDGEEVDKSVQVDGSSIIINPVNGWVRSDDGREYSLSIIGGVSDITGNISSSVVIEPFSIPNLVGSVSIQRKHGNENSSQYFDEDARYAPLVLSVFPGFPCAMDETTLDAENNIAGRCMGAFSGLSEGKDADLRLGDDLLPIQDHPANYPLVVQLSKEVDPRTVVLNETLIVKIIKEGSEEVVDGNVLVDGKKIEFWPENEWLEGELYSYTLKSDYSADCSEISAICDKEGLPLKTKLWDVIVDDVPDTPVGQPEFGVHRSFYKEHIMTPALSGGPDMTIHFRGGEKSSNVVQNLNAPSSDINANFQIDRVTPAEDRDIKAYENLITSGRYRYIDEVDGEQERGAEGQPLITEAVPGTYPGSPREDIDPAGVVPPKNSAKILSLKKSTYTTIEHLMNGSSIFLLSGINVGCGYDEIIDVNMPDSFFGKPIETDPPCATDKFTFLNGALTAEVTNNYDDEKGMEVLIWPGQIMASNLVMRMHTGLSIAGLRSGPQIMRMRYAKDDPECVDTSSAGCSRSMPISAWIQEDDNGNPILKAEMDLYVDAPDLINEFKEAITASNVQEHDLLSYPISMKLEGPVEFDDSGLMKVTQYNTEDVMIDFMFLINGNEINNVEIVIPSFGTHLNFVSENIK